MAVDKTTGNSKGKNVTPLSSVLDIKTLDVDCSGLANAPIDGEFIMVAGHGTAVIQSSGKTSFPASGAMVASNASPECATLAAMVWSHRDQSDLQATGRKRVPVIWKGGIHVKLGLYNYDTTTASTLPGPGCAVYLASNAEATPDGAVANTRMVAHVAGANAPNITLGMQVGVVVAAAATSGGPLEIKLFEHPICLVTI